MPWLQMKQRMRFQSSAASWSQRLWTLSGRLQWQPQPSSRLVCQAVGSNRHFVLPRKLLRSQRRPSFLESPFLDAL
jgi:hypothetical protein